jgi:hypothetical protein
MFCIIFCHAYLVGFYVLLAYVYMHECNCVSNAYSAFFDILYVYYVKLIMFVYRPPQT